MAAAAYFPLFPVKTSAMQKQKLGGAKSSAKPLHGYVVNGSLCLIAITGVSSVRVQSEFSSDVAAAP